MPPDVATSGPGVTEPGSDVTVALDDDGKSLDVFERLVADRPAQGGLVLRLPAVTTLSGELGQTRIEVLDLQVEVDGRVVATRGTDGGYLADVPAAAGPLRATLRYRLAGALVRVTPSLPGRIFALVTPLAAENSVQARRPVLVRVSDRRVLGVTCPAGTGAAQLCGTRAGSTWQAALPAGAAPVTLLQLSLR